MAKYLERPIVVIALLSVISGYAFFSQSGKAALTDPDETFYAETAKEMAAKGEWLTPCIYGKPQFEKPIMFYWLVEASYKVFGVNEFAARFPSGLFALFGLVAVYLLGRLLFSSTTGVFSAISLATCLEYIVLANACVTDMVLFTFMTLGVLFFFYARVRQRDYFYALSAAAFAFAVLTKGPIGVLLPVSIITAYILITGDFEIFKKPAALFLSALVFLAIALPWYVIMYKLHSRVFIDEFFGFHNVTRFLAPEHKSGAQLWYNIPIVFGGFFPWSAFLPFALWHFIRSLSARRPPHDAQRNQIIFVLLWLAAIFVFFSVSSTKLPTYVFPCFMSLALIVGKFWDDFLSGPRNESITRLMAFSFYLLLSAAAVAAIGGYIFIAMDSPDILPGAVVSGLCMILGLALAFTAFVKKAFAAAFLSIAYAVAMTLYPAATLVLPAVEGYESSRPISKAVMAYYEKSDIIASEKDYRAGVAFYTGMIPQLVGSSNNLVDIGKTGRTFWGVLKQKNLFDKMRIIYQYGKKRLVTNSEKRIR